MLRLPTQRAKAQPSALGVIHRDPDTPQDLDVTDIQWEAFCLWMAFSCRRLYKQLQFSPSYWAAPLLFMTKSLQQHQSLMTK